MEHNLKPMTERRIGELIVLCAPSGYLTGARNPVHQPFYDRLEELCLEPQNVIINLTNVEHLGSVAMGQLVRVNDACRKARLSMVICCVDQRIVRIFEITKLSLYLSLRPSEESAIASFDHSVEGEH